MSLCLSLFRYVLSESVPRQFLFLVFSLFIDLFPQVVHSFVLSFFIARVI